MMRREEQVREEVRERDERRKDEEVMGGVGNDARKESVRGRLRGFRRCRS